MLLSACTIRSELLCVLLALLAGFVCAQEATEPPDVAELVRAVRESENWIHDVNSFYLRIESAWTNTAKAIEARRAELKEQFPDEVLDPNRWTGLRPLAHDRNEMAFDRKRLRYLRDDPNTSWTERVWDGKLAVSHENYMAHRQEHVYLGNDPNAIFRFFLSDLSWLRTQLHSFWWHTPDIEQPLDFFGRPEHFRLVDRKILRRADRHILEYEGRGQCQGLTFRWYVDARDRRLRGIAHVRSGRVTMRHWLDDYREVAPGCWFPMTQGYASYDADESGQMYLSFRRDMKVVEVRVNEPLPDEMFRVELKEGVEIQDHRGEEFRRYIHVPQPPSLLGKPIPDFNDVSLDGEMENLRGKPLLICFCDTSQRPSRHCLRQLAAKAAYLREQDITVLVIQAEPSDELIPNAHEFFALARIRNNHKQIRFTWGVRSLPWLILTDRTHTMRSAGFGINQLNEKIKEVTDGKSSELP